VSAKITVSIRLAVPPEHRGWDTIPPDHPALHGLDLARSQRLRAGWWDEQVQALEEIA
jgi:hypothetical protein